MIRTRAKIRKPANKKSLNKPEVCRKCALTENASIVYDSAMKNWACFIIFGLFLQIFPISASQDQVADDPSAPAVQKKHGVFTQFGTDLGRIVSSPFHWDLSDWLWVGGLTAATVVLINNDETIYRKVKEFQADTPFVNAISPFFEGFCKEAPVGIGALFLLHGLIAGDRKSRDTGSLTLQAALHSFVVIQIFKHLGGRQRPSWDNGQDRWVGPAGFFKRYEEGQWSRYDAFASGHTINIWSMATVVAHQYNKTPWVPILCYATATLGGFATMTEDLHWLSDVLVGAALGFAIGKFVVRRNQTKWNLVPTLPVNGGFGLSLQVNL
jgi:membrane-associated phospholipid phosphatase